MPDTTTCRSCSAPIRFTKSPKGASLPLDVKPITKAEAQLRNIAVVYALPPAAFPEHPATAHSRNAFDNAFASGTALYVSHFATCPNAAQHSRRK